MSYGDFSFSCNAGVKRVQSLIFVRLNTIITRIHNSALQEDRKYYHVVGVILNLSVYLSTHTASNSGLLCYCTILPERVF